MNKGERERRWGRLREKREGEGGEGRGGEGGKRKEGRGGKGGEEEESRAVCRSVSEGGVCMLSTPRGMKASTWQAV